MNVCRPVSSENASSMWRVNRPVPGKRRGTLQANSSRMCHAEYSTATSTVLLPCPSELRPSPPCAAHNARGSGSRRPQLKRTHAGRPRAYRTGLAAKVQPSCGRRHATVLVRTRAFESGRDDSSVGPSASAEEETIVTGVLMGHPATGASAIVASRVSPRTANSANM
jgi:hypothetical protein